MGFNSKAELEEISNEGFVCADRLTASQPPGHDGMHPTAPLSDFKSPSLSDLGVDFMPLTLSPGFIKATLLAPTLQALLSTPPSLPPVGCGEARAL